MKLRIQVLYLPFKGKGGRHIYEQVLEVRAKSKVHMVKTKDRMESIVREYRVSCKSLPIRLIIQNTPRGSYVRWRTSAKGGNQQKYLSNKEVLKLELTSEGIKIVSDYCHKVNWVNALTSLLHHNVSVLDRYLTEQITINELSGSI